MLFVPHFSNLSKNCLNCDQLRHCNDCRVFLKEMLELHKPPSLPFPLLSPFHSSPLPSTSLSPPLPFPPVRSRPPLLRLGGLGERFSSPSGSGRSPAAKRYLMNFKLKILPLVATKLTNFRSFSGNETSNWDDWVAEW